MSARRWRQHFNPLIQALFALPIPVVAAVNGPAPGRVAASRSPPTSSSPAQSAYFLQAFVNIGLIPDAGATWLLPRLAGRARAMEMMMLGERVPAEQALEWGMINRVVDDERLPTEAEALATRLAQGPTVALGLIRKLARESAVARSDRCAGRRARSPSAMPAELQDFRSAVVCLPRRSSRRGSTGS